MPKWNLYPEQTISSDNSNLWATVLRMYLTDKIKDALASKKIKIINSH